MIKVKLTNDIVSKLIEIENNKILLEKTKVPFDISLKFKKITMKKSSYASNAIEGNPLTYEQAIQVIDSNRSHYLKPEEEIRNYYLALQMLNEELKNKTPISLKLLLKTQKIIVSGEGKTKTGIRGAMPAGVLFAVYDSKTNKPEYIPPEYKDIIPLLDELFKYINTSSDHPIIKSAVLHYQLVTIHPFEDGNGRTARILSNYYLSLCGYGFKEIGSLEEYFSFNLEEYYSSIQMNLPVLYYEGRNNPPHPEIWIDYYLKIFSLYSNKVIAIANKEIKNIDNIRKQHLSKKAKLFLDYLIENNIKQFKPIELSKKLKVTNRTIVNWSIELSKNSYLKPNLVKKRIISYSFIETNKE